MPRVPRIRRLLHITRDRAGIERAVNDELQFHFDMTMRELMANGMNPDEARREADRRFGDVQRTRERLNTIDRSRASQERRAEWWSAFVQDLRYALRGLRLKPGFAAAVIITLGLGIGANATMFTVVDRLLFRPPRMLIAPDRVGRIYLQNTSRGKETSFSFFGYRRFLDIRENAQTLEASTPFAVRKFAVGTGTATKEMSLAFADPDIWRMFDVKPVLGRFYTEADNVPTDPHAVFVITYGFWQTQYGGRRDVIGQQLDVGADKLTIIGVAPEGFNGFASTPLIGIEPTAINASHMGNPKTPWYSTYNMNWFQVYARRKATASQQATDTDLAHAQRTSYSKMLAADPQRTPIELAKPGAFLGSLLSARGPDASNDSKVATWLGGVALIVLLIACANVANLLLARALRRRREIAVRIALGVSRGRLLMQLITESLLLAVFGALAGLLTAQFGGAFVRRVLLNQESTFSAFTDTRTLLFVAGLAAVAGLFTGLAPVLQAGRTQIAATLKAGAREGVVHRSKLRIGLLIGQAALSVVLLVGAGLFVRSLINVKNTRLGYDADRLLLLDLNMRGMTLDSVQQKALRNQMVERVKTVPGVENASRALTAPFWSNWQLSLYVPGIDSVSKLGDFALQAADPSILETMGTHLVRGRGFMPSDNNANAPHVAIVDQAMAAKIWPGQDPIGKTMRIGADTNPVTTIIGIAEDMRENQINEPTPYYYIPIEQRSFAEDGIFVRTSGHGADYVETVRRALQPMMPGVSYVTVTAMSGLVNDNTRSWNLGAIMFAIFGTLALILAAIGLYSVLAYSVTQRMHEMGVRVALGAQARDVIRLIVREGLWIVLPGVALGVLIALAAGHWVAPLLFNVSPKDPPVLGGVILMLVAVAVTASWIPARRASRVDPNEALRAD